MPPLLRVLVYWYCWCCVCLRLVAGVKADVEVVPDTDIGFTTKGPPVRAPLRLPLR